MKAKTFPIFSLFSTTSLCLGASVSLPIFSYSSLVHTSLRISPHCALPLLLFSAAQIKFVASAAPVTQGGRVWELLGPVCTVVHSVQQCRRRCMKRLKNCVLARGLTQPPREIRGGIEVLIQFFSLPSLRKLRQQRTDERTCLLCTFAATSKRRFWRREREREK